MTSGRHLLPVLLAAVSLTVAGVSAVAFAQESSRPWSLRDLFAPRKPQRLLPRDPSPPAATPRPRKKSPAQRKSAEPRDERPEVAILPKQPDARTVLVVGDFIGSGLAEGLDMLFAAESGIRIADRSNGSSGFVREDHFDWPGEISAVVEAEKPAVAIVMIGANDRQPMRIGQTSATLRSDAWTREYSARAASFASALSGSGVPLIWVGAPPFKSPRSSSDMLALNEIYRRVAADVGAEFVDVWEGFVDENGAFSTTGADITGQTVRLRSGDGVNLTAAGKRKLAFYVEKMLKQRLGTGGASPGGAGVPVASAKPDRPAQTDRTLPIALDDPALDGGGELLGAAIVQSPARPSTGSVSTTATAPARVIGRADDFSWPPLAATAPASSPPATPDPASAKQGVGAAD
ncbi:DUF459 domain-containing protein [Mesorhizobium sp. LHD-90]|uniref:SGNH/GDSL hydrolase family protein n=1 Tax=Mesorhizobium sp. LHD-90 TaxID=3071414 RepID=UPI0027E09B80|nr:DUF459 domain-containing protein [Mesorhizobium sp. LHD-90]MDQ6433657.1 DUF459 domain-containing protein [Mesorhizobium sp. LHD-90]